jgi:hypothetical protein
MADEQAAPAQGAGGDGGGIVDVLQQLDQGLFKVNEALKSGPAPDEAKAAFQQALESFRQGLEILTGGGEAAEGPSQTTTPEQGGNPNAVPMSMGRPG